MPSSLVAGLTTLTDLPFSLQGSDSMQEVLWS